MSEHTREELVSILERKYREFGWDVEGAAPRRRNASGDILRREIDELADALLSIPQDKESA